MPYNPLTEVRVEPERVNPPLKPDSVPPSPVKSVELLAKAAIGSAKASSATTKRTRFILPPEPVFGTLTVRIFEGLITPLGDPASIKQIGPIGAVLVPN
jgi:hypothetical protein